MSGIGSMVIGSKDIEDITGERCNGGDGRHGYSYVPFA